MIAKANAASELQAAGTFTPRGFISVLLAIALPVILNVPPRQ